jgi:hypothetical protein
MKFNPNNFIGDQILPVEIVLSPEWWHKNEGIAFDKDFFFHPFKRVEEEQHMEKALYGRWGKYGLGKLRDEKRPEIGAVHLASGFLLSEMLGCRVEYYEAQAPRVIQAHREDLSLNAADAFRSESFRLVLRLWEKMKERYGYLTGDINWGGILNLAFDLRGEHIFTDMMQKPDDTKKYFREIASVITTFTEAMSQETHSTSISVNRMVRNLPYPVFLHPECSHTMIAAEDYERFLLEFDRGWSGLRPFGIHYCGPDAHRMAGSFAKIPALDFLDVGWGGDIKTLRRHLPMTFLNINLSPLEIAHQSPGEIRDTITMLVKDSENPYLTGICCINIGESIADDRVNSVFETVMQLRDEYSKDLNAALYRDYRPASF